MVCFWSGFEIKTRFNCIIQMCKYKERIYYKHVKWNININCLKIHVLLEDNAGHRVKLRFIYLKHKIIQSDFLRIAMDYYSFYWLQSI